MTGALERGVALLEGFLFPRRRALAAAFLLLTLGLGASASRLQVDAAFAKMIPLFHPYMRTMLAYRETFGGSNRVLVAMRQQEGDIFNPDFFTALKELTDDVFFLRGVDRASVTSLFTPNVRFIEVVEEGFAGGNVIPADFRGAPEDFARVRRNILKSATGSRLVAADLRGALVRAELLEVDPATGERLDYQEAAARLEAIRRKHERGGRSVHIIGFAKAVGDIADGARGVVAFFGVAFAVTAVLLAFYCHTLRLAGMALVCALLPVAWLLGLLPLMGYGIDPLSILVPFLVFSIGVSHAVQMTQAWRLETGAGADALEAARRAFRKLFIPGALALVTDGISFLVLLHIRIGIVQELAVTAGVGVLLMIVTNKMVLPLLLSWLRPEPPRPGPQAPSRLAGAWSAFAGLVEPGRARFVLAAALALLAWGLWKERALRTGDLGQGLPELRADSRYNRDTAAIVDHFTIGVDVISVIVQTTGVEGACTDFRVMDAIDRFDFEMRRVPGVQSVLALSGLAKVVNAGYNEGSLKWRALSRNRDVLAQSVTPIDTSSGLLNPDCSAMQVMLFTRDHQAETIARIVAAVKRFARAHDSERIRFLLASGNVGVMAATNEAVDAAQVTMLASIYGVIIFLTWLTFRSWSATLCIILPLALVSVLCNALMALLGIGLKVNTLPVIALGVGVGVDYGIYLFDWIQHARSRGATLRQAFEAALHERGGAAVFTAVTMTIGVGSWAFSALKFQADMGILLAFMFLVNMVAALTLLPALAAFLIGRGRRLAVDS